MKKLRTALFSLGLSLLTVAAFAFTPAGTVISNSATVTYSGTTATYTATSNTVSVTVAARTFGVDMNPPRAGVDVSGAQGAKVYTPVSCVNKGDGPDRFTYSTTGTLPTGYAVGFVTDTNGDGIHQDTETSVVTQTDWVAAAATGGRAFAEITIPATATTVATINVRATSVLNTTIYDYSVVRVTPTVVSTPEPELTVTASASVGTAKPGENFSVDYVIVNTGTADATAVNMRVAVPAEAQVVDSTIPGATEDAEFVFPLKALAPGETITVTITFEVL
jgi:uncharacterized membrane protein